jgi:homoserine kinase type II
MKSRQVSPGFRAAYGAAMAEPFVDRAVDLHGVLTAWDIRPEAVHEPPPGTNNFTRLIEAHGRRFVLRVTRNLTADQAQAEAVLRATITATRPAISVPEPIPTTDGIYTSTTDSGVATLSAFLPGIRPDLGTESALFAFGGACGRLVSVMAALPHHLMVHDWTGGPLPLLGRESAGDLAGDLTRAGAAGPAVAALMAAVTEVMTGHQRLVEGLPVQLVHGDHAAGNALADRDLAAGGRVTAILDFEVAGLEWRVNDLVSALAQTTALDSPSFTRALVAGFLVHTDLTEPERDAVPDLLVERALGTILWRAAAWRRGDVGVDQVAERLRWLVETRAFVREHRADLQSMLRDPGPGASPSASANQ